MAEELGKITLFLSKPDKQFADVIDLEKIHQVESENKKIRDFDVAGRRCKFYCRQYTSSDDNPLWLDFINSSLGDDERVDFDTFSKRPSGLLLIQWDDRVFAASFGVSGSSWLKKHQFEADFGIIVAMNLCGNEEVRQAKSAIQSSTTQIIDRQVSKPSNTNDFGMSDTEFLKYISAHLNENTDVTLQGKNTLTIKAIKEEKLTWDKLFNYAEQFIDAYESEHYKQLFPNYPNLTPVSHELKIKLDDILLNEMQNRNFANTHFAIPEFIADDEYSFSYSNNAKRDNNVFSHLSVEHMDGEIFTDITKVSLNQLHSKKVYAYSHEENKILSYKNWSIYDCLITELNHDGECYILSTGEWLKVDSDFFNELNLFIKSQVVEHELDDCYCNLNIFCNERKQNREELFNNQYCGINEFAVLFDQAKLQIGRGRKDKEFCDIFEYSNDSKPSIIHVKKIGGSSAVNHLFSQAKFYCEAFLGDELFLADIRAHIDSSGNVFSDEILDHIKTDIRDVNGGDYKVKLWLLYDSSKAKPELTSLPLMAKYELRSAIGKLRNILKYNEVSVSFIPANYIHHKEAKTNN